MKKKPQQNKRIPLMLIGAGLILILGSVTWLLLFNRAAPSGPQASAPEQAGGQAAESSMAEIPRVGLADAKAAYDLKTAVFLDVRSPQEYNESHIPGAINLPLEELEPRLGELDKSAWIITY